MGGNYTAIVGFSLGAVETDSIIEAGESAHITFLTEPRAIEELEGGAAGVPWIGCAMKVRSLGRKNPAVKSEGGARRLELPEHWAGGNILAPGELFGVTITGDDGVPADDGQNEFQVTLTYPSPSEPVTLELSTTEGEGSATFSDGQTTKTIENSQPLIIVGRIPSSIADNVLLAAKRQGQTLAEKRFSVVRVAISIRTTGQPSEDNSAKPKYDTCLSGSLGPVVFLVPSGVGCGGEGLSWCGTGVELKGVVTPSDYMGQITLRRTHLESVYYHESTEFQRDGPSVPTLMRQLPRS